MAGTQGCDCHRFLRSCHLSLINLCLQHCCSKPGCAFISLHSVWRIKVVENETKFPERAKGTLLYSALVIDGDMIYMLHCRGKVMCHRVLCYRVLNHFALFLWFCVPLLQSNQETWFCSSFFSFCKMYCTFNITTVWHTQVDYWENV